MQEEIQVRNREEAWKMAMLRASENGIPIRMYKWEYSYEGKDAKVFIVIPINKTREVLEVVNKATITTRMEYLETVNPVQWN